MLRNASVRSVPLLTTIVVLGIALFVSPARGQAGNGERFPATARIGDAVSPLDPQSAWSDGLALPTAQFVSLPRPERRAPLPTDDEGVRFDRALAGSAMGAAVGSLLGGVLIAAAEPDRSSFFEDDEENKAESLGFLMIAGGAPVGAVLHTRIPRDHTGAYFMAVLGEIVLGGAGLALGATLGRDSDRRRLIGGLAVGGAGVILGAAGGAVLGTLGGPGGALNYENGSWHAQPPAVRVGLHRQPRPGLHGTVSLVSVEL